MKKIRLKKPTVSNRQEPSHYCPKCLKPNKLALAVCGWCGQVLRKPYNLED